MKTQLTEEEVDRLAGRFEEIASMLRSGAHRDGLEAALGASMDARMVYEEVVERMSGGPAEVPTDLEMALLGWDVKVQTTSSGWGAGAAGCSVWVERWNWHGHVCDRVSFRASARTTPGIALAKEKAKRLALRAWREFTTPGLPPRQQGDMLLPDKLREQIHKHSKGQQ